VHDYFSFFFPHNSGTDANDDLISSGSYLVITLSDSDRVGYLAIQERLIVAALLLVVVVRGKSIVEVKVDYEAFETLVAQLSF
jgi:hypothetical protein